MQRKYRLGIMGFFAHPELTSESPHQGGTSGSQLQALRSLPAEQVADIEDRMIATQFKGYGPKCIDRGWVGALGIAGEGLRIGEDSAIV